MQPLFDLQSVSKLLGQIAVSRQMLQTLRSSGPPFQCCVSFAIKFDESGCFGLKLNIARGGRRGGERIYRQQFLHTGLLSNTVCVSISFESDCSIVRAPHGQAQVQTVIIRI